MGVLGGLNLWFEESRSALAEFCVAQAPGAARPYLLAGPDDVLSDPTLRMPPEATWPDRLRLLRQRPMAPEPVDGQPELPFG